ncbi:hypothetical protein BVRB_028360 [Beta vulgaris subsp. vulgaris]|uniref:Uncharacterized protein n=1 Tax=Beta vulgaris subsp. vulgaris TaxID=3555 RepID=A0A0J8B1H2_BETVV|nr:hypothetical protein BVRB_028360 [Beta vulgaris subsp. vulgaris]
MPKRPRSPSSSSDPATDKRQHWSLGAAETNRSLYAELPAVFIANDPVPTTGSVPALVSSLVANDYALRSGPRTRSRINICC